jgi:hypothetical protein
MNRGSRPLISRRKNRRQFDVGLSAFVLFVAGANAHCGGMANAGCPTCRNADSSSTACPAQEPSAGEQCTIAGATCWYGDSPRPDCRDIWNCTSGLWHAARQGCAQLPDGYCPASQPDMSTSCTAVFDPTRRGDCGYAGGVLCGCPCVAGHVTDAGVMACGPSRFVCFPAPTTPGCPSTPPNIGTSCTVQGVQCVYGNPCDVDGIAVLCRAAVWSAGFPNCPL